jgi:hypothetical protein
MTRLTSIATLIAALALAAPAFAQQADLAAKLNDEGKELMFAGKFAEASAKFRDAVARVPEPKYFFNLCTSLFQEGKFDEAMTACTAIDKNNPTADQKAKTDKLIGKIKDEAATQHVELHPTGGGGMPDPNPTNPGDPPPLTPNPNYTPAVGRPPTQSLVAAGAAENKYTWTLGAELFAGGGKIGQDGYFGTAAGGFRIKGDYMLNPAMRLGAQVYFGITHFGQGNMDAATADTLDVFDIGVAGYKHLCASTSRLCLTPLVGVHLALMSPANESDGSGSQLFNYSGVGARAEIGLEYSLGSRMEHVVHVGIGANLYSQAFSEPADGEGETAAYWGLDRGGAAGYLSIGYTYRFNTPIGSSPFVTLE